MLLDVIKVISCQNVYRFMKWNVFLELVFDWLLTIIIDANLYTFEIRSQVFPSNVTNALEAEKNGYSKHPK